MLRKTAPQQPDLYPLDWVIRFAQSIVLTAIISFALSACAILTVALIPMGLGLIPGLSSFANGVTGTILHILSVFGGGQWWSGILVISLPISGVSVLFDAFVFLQNHAQEAWRAWKSFD